MNKEMTFDFIKNRKTFLIISACIIVVGLIFNLIFGVELDVTFTGGTVLKYSYTGTIDTSEAESFFTEQFGSRCTAELSNSGGIQMLNVYNTSDISNEQEQAIEAAVAEKFADNAIKQVSANSISPTVGTLFFIKCLFATLLATIFLIVYVAIRFRKIGGVSAALMAIAALAHDLLIVYFAFVIFRIPLNDNFVAVVLTILGYSLNDTIVIYDRIRENRSRLGAKASIDEVVNVSLRQSFRRTLNTSITTCIVVLTLVIVAVTQNLESIISFAVPLLFGVISGFYSSTFLCSPVWAIWVAHREKKKSKK
ncbi:MAG: protein translocase subunit SecF [Clostridia bacterium]|nr:protein translocase subunit SecF [Clostridia bacterium]